MLINNKDGRLIVKRIIFYINLFVLSVILTSCSTSQSRYVLLNERHTALAEDVEIEVFKDSLPERPFERISRLDVHLEKSHFVSSDFDNALPLLKKEARMSGADGIIEVKERSSSVLETKVYHVTAIGIRFKD